MGPVGPVARVLLQEPRGLSEVVGIEQDLESGLLDQGHQIPGVQTPVEGGVDGAQLAAGEKGVQVLHPVPGQDSHPIPLADAGHLPQPAREPVGPLVERPIAEPQHGLLTGINDRDPIGRIKRAPAQIVTDIHNKCSEFGCPKNKDDTGYRPLATSRRPAADPFGVIRRDPRRYF